MNRLSWCDSTTATAPPRVRVERFCGTTRRSVHLLGEVRCIKVHHREGENTVPCGAPQECPYCTDPRWKLRTEHFAPALLQNKKANVWLHVVAVFTPGGWNKINARPAGPHRGRLLEVWRQGQGNARGGVLMVKEVARIDPPIPAFDIEPHLLALWFPEERELPPAQIPEPIPYVPDAAPVQQSAAPFKFTAEAAAKMDEWRARLRGEQDAQEDAEEEKPTEAQVREVAKNPANYGPRERASTSMTQGAEKAVEEKRRRAAALKEAGDAVEAGGIMDYILNGKVPANGKKGGAQ
jgi:hypothetical protein